MFTFHYVDNEKMGLPIVAGENSHSLVADSNVIGDNTYCYLKLNFGWGQGGNVSGGRWWYSPSVAEMALNEKFVETNGSPVAKEFRSVKFTLAVLQPKRYDPNLGADSNLADPYTYSIIGFTSSAPGNVSLYKLDPNGQYIKINISPVTNQLINVAIIVLATLTSTDNPNDYPVSAVLFLDPQVNNTPVTG